jgi:bifunctional non-homologous end joining protein LigD
VALRSKTGRLRALLIKDGAQLALFSRKHKDLARPYPAIAAAGCAIKASQAILDGEIGVLDVRGPPSLHSMQSRGAQLGHQMVFYAFDLLHLDGRDLTREPLHRRRAELPALIDGTALRLSALNISWRCRAI